VGVKRLGILAVLMLALAGAGAQSAGAVTVDFENGTSAPSGSCATGTPAVVNGKPVCLRKGKRCKVADDRKLKRYGYRCRRAKARRGAKRSKTGKLVLTNPAAARFDAEIRPQPDGTVSKKVALEAFAAAFGPLPGVKISKEDVNPRPQSGTEAIAWVQRYRDQLTPAQRDAVDARLADVFPPVSSATSDPAQITAILGDVQKRLEAHLGPLGVPVKFWIKTEAKGTALADAMIYNGSYCGIALYPSGQALSDGDLASALTHELFHCFQRRWRDVVIAPWLGEGSATWAAAKIDEERGYVSGLITNWWNNWLDLPYVPLFERDYGALGFFAHIEEAGLDPWKTIRKMVEQPDPAKAYDLATDPEMLNTLTTGYFREPALGKGWDLTGPGIPQTGPEILKATIDSSEDVLVGAQARSADQREMAIKSEVVDVSVEPGALVNGRLRDSDGTEYPLAQGSYCAKPNGCTCPKGESGPSQPLHGKALVAVWGGPADTGATFTGESLKDWCKSKPPGKSSYIVVSGATSAQFTKKGLCDPQFDGDPTKMLSIFTSDNDYNTMALTFSLDHYKGPGDYSFNPRSGEGQLNIGDNGGSWQTDQMPDEADAGGVHISSQTSTHTTGFVHATAINTKTGSIAHITGPFSCAANIKDVE
jgi:hypothetical protein